MPDYPGIGDDVTHLMGGSAVPGIGEDVSHLMGASDLYDPNRHIPSAEDYQPAAPEGSAVGRFLGNAWDAINPITAVTSLAHAAVHPIDAVQGLVGAQVAEGRKAIDNARRGHISEAIGHGGAALLPLLGPAAAAAGEQIGSGDIAGGLGKAAGIIAPLAVGAALPEKVAVPAPLRNPNPVAADAAAFADRVGAPLDAGTATGNRFVKAIQHISDRSLGGSMIAERAAQAQQDGLASIGEQLAAKGYSSPATLEQAGDSIRDAVRQNIVDASKTADAGYSVLRKIEANPAHAKVVQMADGSTQLMPLPVDLRGVKTAVQPLLDELTRQARVAPLMGEKATAARILDKIVNGPDHAPLSAADAALGDLKTFTRSDEPVLRTSAQGKVTAALSQLHAAVDDTAAQAGPLAQAALRTGRDATKAKYGSQQVIESLNAEPVKTIQRLTAPKDSAIEQLRAVSREAPQAMPIIGRAYLDDMLAKATAEGGFKHGQALAAQWEKLGTQTKLALYQDPGYVKDIDRFMNLAKMSSESANPSGTAHTALAAVQGGWLFTNPMTGVPLQVGAAALSKLLHSPTGVRLLTKGLTIPVKNKVAAAAWASDFTNMIGATSPSGSQTPDLAGSR